MFSINRSSQFFFLYIIRHISVVICEKRLVAITTIQLGLKALFKVARIFNFKDMIRKDLKIGLTF